MEINLVRNGIFPITENPLDSTSGVRPEISSDVGFSSLPATGYDFPGTLQGEGKLIGLPVLFVRTSGCNLRCSWPAPGGGVSICDTPYASHYPEEVESLETDEVVEILRANLGHIRHIVISGGEPTLQSRALTELARKLKKSLDVHITLETNGVLFIPELVNFVDLFSISPKLESSEPGKEKNKHLDRPVEENYIRDHKKFRINIDTLQKYINACMNLSSYYGDRPGVPAERRTDKDFQLKFVITSGADVDEIRKDFLDKLSFVNNDDVVLMPVGGTPEILAKSTDLTARLAIRNGFRFTPRLQIDLFGDTAGT